MAGSMPPLRTPSGLVGRAEVLGLVEILTGELIANQAATRAGVDRSTIVTLRNVAWDGAIAELQASRPARCPPGSRGAEVAVVRSRRFRRALKERQRHEAG